jgi:hypothetical protein
LLRFCEWDCNNSATPSGKTSKSSRFAFPVTVSVAFATGVSKPSKSWTNSGQSFLQTPLRLDSVTAFHASLMIFTAFKTLKLFQNSLIFGPSS